MHFNDHFSLGRECHSRNNSSIRHLYFTRTHLISFESVTKRTAHLISIDCNIKLVDDHDITVPEVIVDEDICIHARFLYFISHCWPRDCVYRNLLPRLLNRMSYLKCLRTSEDAFAHE